jgi:peptidoglycan/xylan/chitin deacetylase (PgdA/CDA1 family)
MRAVVLTLALLLPLAATAADHAVILQYHHVSATTPASTSVTPDQFAAQLARLDAAGFRVASLPDVLDALRRGEQVPDSTVCLTADDGYRNLREHALPLLRARGWPMTVFVCTEQVDQGHPLHLDWDDLRALRDEGWTIASHGATHDHLVRRRDGEDEAAWRARVTQEIAGSVARLREELGHAPDLFAYPYGEYDPALCAVVRELGLVGIGQHSGAAWSEGDFTTVPRFPASGDYADPDDLAFKAAVLPLPVVAAVPVSSVLDMEQTRPELRLTLAPGDWSADQLAAHVSGQGRGEPVWDDQAPRTFTVQAPRALPEGRSRYNITAPRTDGRRWYWYSQPWIRGFVD